MNKIRNTDAVGLSTRIMGGAGGLMLLALTSSFSLSVQAEEPALPQLQGAVIRDHRTPGGEPKTYTPSGTFQPQGSSSGSGGTSSVVGGIAEPNYKYPWVVRMNGCSGVLIDAQWVLTAAHCVTPRIGFGSVTYRRTDPQTGMERSEAIGPDQNSGPANN